MKRPSFLLASFLAITVLTGCQSVPQQRQAMRESSEEKLTLGVAQREIREGLSQAEVAQALGSPNMVTRDANGVETWIYDKISTEFTYSNSAGGAALLLGTVSGSAGVSSRSQRTLTIILKFTDGKVTKFTYSASSF
jgi:outer membrane protein assembly factor BamE (lipoprotein component of BamABCDE complex)